MRPTHSFPRTSTSCFLANLKTVVCANCAHILCALDAATPASDVPGHSEFCCHVPTLPSCLPECVHHIKACACRKASNVCIIVQHGHDQLTPIRQRRMLSRLARMLVRVLRIKQGQCINALLLRAMLVDSVHVQRLDCRPCATLRS